MKIVKECSVPDGSPLMQATTPHVIAHRGASAELPEHTIAAYRKAIAEGADGVECDVRLTRDGVLVCVHDRRVDRTSTGRGPVSTLELADLEELDFGAWKGLHSEESRSVVTLAKLLDVVAESPRSLDVAIETKHPTRYAGLVESTLVTLLQQRELINSRHQVRVMSFATSSLRRVRVMAPDLETVLLLNRAPLRWRSGSLPACADIAGPSLVALRTDPSYAARLRSQGRQVHVWTVDELTDVDFVVSLGVDAIITNRPAAVREHLSSMQTM